MASVNKVLLLGNVTRDPELKYIPSGAAVCDFGLALNRNYKNKAGEKVEEVCFVDVVSWAKTAEVCAEYVKKGRQVHVEGYLKQDTWEDKDSGQKRSKIKVIAEQVTFVGSRGEGKKKEEAPAEDIAF